jgi:PST family polysaccharide transporter
VPFLTYPYLIKVVGKELYGVVVFAQAVVSYVSLVVNFGFNLSASKSIAENRENKQVISEIVSSIYVSKFVIWLLCLVVYVLIISLIPFFKSNYYIFLYSFLLTFNELLFPAWFFQGIEKMKYTTLINVSIRSLFIVAIFMFVSSPSDYVYIPLLNGIGALLGGLVASYIVFGKEKIKFVFLPIKLVYIHFKESIPLFVSIASIQVYGNINKIVIGAFLGMSEVAIYDLGEKISNLLKLPIGIVNQAVFPKVSREKSIKFINRIMFVVAGLSGIGYILVFVFSKWIVLFFMHEYIQSAVDIVRILSSTVVIVSFSMFLANCRLIPFGYNKAYMNVYSLTCLFFFVFIGCLWLFQAINLYSISIMVVCVEITCLLLLLYYNNKYRLLKNAKYSNSHSQL